MSSDDVIVVADDNARRLIVLIFANNRRVAKIDADFAVDAEGGIKAAVAVVAGDPEVLRFGVDDLLLRQRANFFNTRRPWALNKDRIAIFQGDITTLPVDAIVNAANESLLGGAGVDGAIHRAAGPRLLEECRSLGGCPTGEAKLTGGYELPARYVIHTVGPIWAGGGQGEDELLAGCYRNCFAVAEENHIRSIAFPAISTGAYRFPIELATRIAVDELSKFLRTNLSVEKVTFVCFNQEANRAYQAAVQGLAGG